MTDNTNNNDINGIEDFLGVLQGNKPHPNAHQVLFTIEGQKTNTFSYEPGNFSVLKGIVGFEAQVRDLYYEVCLQNKKPDYGQRGRAITAYGMPGFWLDLDIQGPNHKKDHYPENEEQVLQFLDSLPWKYTMLIHSGGGFQVLFLFKDYWVFKDDKERQHAADLMQRFQNFVNHKAADKGWRFDTTSDLARLLRPVGSKNHKSDPPKPVVLVGYYPENLYEISDFESVLDKYADDEEKQKGTHETVSTQEQSSWTGPESLIEPIYAACLWAKYCKNNAKTLGYQDWFAIICLLKCCKDSEKLIHEWSEAHPEYSAQATQKQADYADGYKPRTCKSIKDDLGHGKLCAQCKYSGLIKTPATLGDPRTLALALVIVNNAVVQLQTDDSIIYKPACLKSLLVIKKEDPSAWIRIRKILKKSVEITQLEKQMKRYRKNNPDEFASEKVAPYYTRGHQTYYSKPTRDGFEEVLLCNFHSRIIEEVHRYDGENEYISYRLETVMEDGEKLPIVDIPAETFKSLKWVSSKYGAGAIVHPIVSSSHLSTAIQYLSKGCKIRKVFTCTGWNKVNGVLAYMSKSGAVGENGMIPGVQVELLQGGVKDYSLTVPSQEADFKQIMPNSINFLNVAPYKITVPLFIGIYLAPLASFVDIPFSFFVFGTTGTLKSSTVGVVQAHYGKNFSVTNLPGNWMSTENSLELLTYLAKDAPTVVDDFKYINDHYEDKKLDKKIERVGRGAGNKAGRLRMDKDFKNKAPYYPRGLTITTGEELPKGESLRARTLFIEVSQGNVDLNKLSILQSLAASGVLSSAVWYYVKWLAKNGRIDAIKSSWSEKKNNYRSSLMGQIKGHARFPDMVATLMVGADVFCDFVLDIGLYSAENAANSRKILHDQLIEVGKDQIKILQEEDPVEVFLETISSTIANGELYLEDPTNQVPANASKYGWGSYVDMNNITTWKPNGDRIGWISGTDIYLNSDAAYNIVKNKYSWLQSKKMLLKRLKEKRLLLSTGSRTNTNRPIFKGDRSRKVHIHEDTLFK